MQHLCVKNNKYLILFQFHPTSSQTRRNSTWYRVQEGFWGKRSKSVCCCCKTWSFNSHGSKGKQGLLRQEKNSGGLALPYLPAADTCLLSILLNISLHQFSISVHKNVHSNDGNLKYPSTKEGNAADQQLPHILYDITFSSLCFSLCSTVVIKPLYSRECYGSDNHATGNMHCGPVDVDQRVLEGCRIVGSPKCHCHSLWDIFL
jgi:hypothetical protein